MNNLIISIFIAVIGLSIGSFLNVCIYRIPIQKSIIKPPSNCPNCNNKLKWWHNIPLFSYILLHGRCYYCNTSISIRYPLVELLTALLLVLSYLKFDLTLVFVVYSIFIMLMIVIAFIDYYHYLIYNIFTYSGIILGLFFSLIPIHVNPFTDAVFSLIISLATLSFIRLIGNKILKKETMGIGDIKLAGLIGVFLGWKLMYLSLFISSTWITLIFLIRYIISKSGINKEYQLGFYFAMSAIICVFIGNEILDTYILLTMIK